MTGIGLQRETSTNETGSFSVPNLPGGNYEIQVEAPGFKSLVRSGIRLDTDQVANFKLQLDVGQLAEKVEVVGEATPIDTSNGDVSRIVTGQQLQNYALPAILISYWASCPASSRATEISRPISGLPVTQWAH